MNIDNIQSLASLINMVDALAKSGDEGQVLAVDISRFGSPTILLTYEFFIEIFSEYELKAQESSKALVVTYVNGVEISSIVP